jgi:hypothetical protein
VTSDPDDFLMSIHLNHDDTAYVLNVFIIQTGSNFCNSLQLWKRYQFYLSQPMSSRDVWFTLGLALRGSVFIVLPVWKKHYQAATFSRVSD